MIIKVSIEILKSKYGSSIANTELSLDSDDIDTSAVIRLAGDMAQSAIRRAQAKLAKEAEEVAANEEPTQTVNA